MTPNSLPESKLLNNLFSYDPDTGHLTWKNPTSNSVKPGDIAGGLNHGYIIVTIERKKYRAHRIIWKMVTGSDPIDEIDHINRDRSDNSLINLRDATPAVQQRNQPTRKDNTSGTPGVQNTNDGKPKLWRACINNNDGKRITKSFATEAEAIAHRRKWEIEFNYVGD